MKKLKKSGLLMMTILSLIIITGCDFNSDVTKGTNNPVTSEKEDVTEGTNNPVTSEKEDVTEGTNNLVTSEKEDVTVVSFKNSNVILNSKNTATVNIPKINSSKSNAVKLNEKILDDYLLFMYEMGFRASDCKIYESCGNEHSINYQYITKNNIIAITVEAKIDSVPSSGFGNEGLNSYFYDVKNAKELTYAEAMPKLGLTFGGKEEKCGYFYIKNGKPTISYIGMGCSE